MSQIIKAGPGQSIYAAACDAIGAARFAGEDVVMRFNDLGIRVSSTSSPSDICTIYSLKAQIRRLGGKEDES